MATAGPGKQESTPIVTLDEIKRAQQRLQNVAVRTPLIAARVAHDEAERRDERRLYVKPENLQPVGSFKLRGAYNKIASLTPDERRRGVIAYSSGNHAQGVAYAARALGVRAVIVMPRTAPAIKRASTESMGAGHIVEFTAEQTARTICDGLRTQSVGAIPFAHMQRFVDDVVTVTEEEIREAMRRLAGDPKVVAEPSGAVGVAAFLFHRDQLPRTRMNVAVVSGGNVEPKLLSEILGEPPKPA